MKIMPLAAVTGFTALIALTAGTAMASPPGPAGEWRVADGTATVRIEKCGAYFCGFVASAADPGKDIRNPDPAKRNRSVIGIEIMFNLKSDGQGGFGLFQDGFCGFASWRRCGEGGCELGRGRRGLFIDQITACDRQDVEGGGGFF